MSSSRRKPQLRHPGEAPYLVIPAKAPNFVIPAKAGIQLLAPDLRLFATTDPHPCVFRSPSLASESLLLLLAQEKVTKEKAPRVGRPPLRGGFATGGRGSLTGHPWPDSELARIPARDPAGFFRPPSAAPHGDPGSKAKQSIGWALAHRGGAHRWAEAHPIKNITRAKRAPLLRQGCRALLLPPGSPSAAARARRKKPVGSRAGCARVRCQAMDGLSANLRSALAQSPGTMPGDRGRGGAFSLVTFSWASKRK